MAQLSEKLENITLSISVWKHKAVEYLSFNDISVQIQLGCILVVGFKLEYRKRVCNLASLVDIMQ